MAIEAATDPGNELRRKQGVATAAEEIIMYAHRIATEQGLPDIGQFSLELRLRCALRCTGALRPVRLRQRLLIELAVRRQRNLGNLCNRRRNQEVR